MLTFTKKSLSIYNNIKQMKEMILKLILKEKKKIVSWIFNL